MKTLELLAPAGSVEALDAAVGEGADAVYLGLKTFNARLRSANFAYAQVEAAVRTLHRMGRKIYITVNTVFEQREADRMYQLLKYLSQLGVDGIIVQDFGVVRMVRDNFPQLKIHASTQMNIAGSRAANVLSKAGVTRTVLARELPLADLKTIRENTNIELEVFVHGALCISASGLCLYSSYLGGKSANRGMCTQACRRLYAPAPSDAATETDAAYYFSPLDLQLLEHIPDLAAAGINAVKIEGRMKSAEYVGSVVRAYRRVIDAIGGDVDAAMNDAKQILQNDFARKKTIFHFEDSSCSPVCSNAGWLNPDQDGGTGIKLGTILRVKEPKKDEKESGMRDANDCSDATLPICNLPMPSGKTALVQCGDIIPRIGDSIRLHRADDSFRKSFKLTKVEIKGHGEGQLCALSIPDGFSEGDSIYIIQTKAGSRRYAPVLPKTAEHTKRQPGHDHAPLIHYGPQHSHIHQDRKTASCDKLHSKILPQGLYVAISNIEDMYVVQSVKPAALILSLTAKNARLLCSGREAYRTLPFKPADTIFSLDPFFAESTDTLFCDYIPRLIEHGCTRWIINNLGHLSFFKTASIASGCTVIAGPYLYTFNRFAAAFLDEQGVPMFVTPLENNRQNLERTFEKQERHKTMVTVFAYPHLFHIQADLSKVYNFSDFTDNRSEQFKLVHDGTASAVLPDKPFSIVDKIPFLKQAGFKHFIIDFCGMRVRKQDYKMVMSAAFDATPLPHTTRFNYKDGFYTEEKKTDL